MSSSERTGAGGKAVAAERRVAPTRAADDDGRDDGDIDAPADPWFTPGPKRTSAAPPDASDAALAPPAGGDKMGHWFLSAGRAGLLPDSMTDSSADGPLRSTDQTTQGEAASSPPWGPEATAEATGIPPPWENGPWPGPGDPAAASRRLRPPTASIDQAASEAEAASTRRRPVQLVFAAAAGAVVLVVIIVVIVVGTSGSPAGGCGTYPAPVRQAYVRTMTDLRGNAPASVQAAAFGQAASRANAAAAATGQIGVRTALFTMASDLDQAHADVIANRTPPPTLRQHLAADGTALPASCPS